jgi:hypothetical protein
MKRRKSSDGSPRPVITPGNAKRAIAVGKVLAPVLLPIAMRAVGVARGAWDEHRARRLGVAPGELNHFSGKGGALHARIVGIAHTLVELRATHTGGERAERIAGFIGSREARLADLAAAVRAAEQMPTDRRRAAHRAVAAELDRIEPEILDLLGVGDTDEQSRTDAPHPR